jgi:hypothetical protein
LPIGRSRPIFDESKPGSIITHACTNNEHAEPRFFWFFFA